MSADVSQSAAFARRRSGVRFPSALLWETANTAQFRAGDSKLRILYQSTVGSGIPLVPQFGDETDDALRQNIGFLERRKMATRLCNCPAPEIEELLRQRAWGTNDLVGELYVARRRFDSPSLWDQVVDYPLPVVAGVVGPKRRPDRARRPVHHHRRNQVVFGESALRIAVAVAPPGELLDDPSGETDGRVGQRVSRSLRARPLQQRVPGFLVQPFAKLAQVGRLFLRGVLRPAGIVAQREHVQVKPQHGVGVRVRHPRTYVSAPIPCGDHVLLVAERAGHKLRQGIRAVDEAESVLEGPKRESVAGQRQDNDAEAAALTGVRKQVNDLVELPHRAWPAVEEQDRDGIIALSPLVDEVQIDALQGRAVLLEGVQLRLLRTPVVLVLPVGGELYHVREARPVAPLGARDLVRPARAVQALPQIGK